MNSSIQPILENEMVCLLPLTEDDFNLLYTAAADPKIWEQHPNKDRWQKEIFQSFFEGALKSRGAFKIIDKRSGMVAGSTRFYDYKESDKSIFIGYTFYATQFWGKGFNPSVKKLMLDYIFSYVERVYFHIGATNFRSQTAITRLGASKIGVEEIAYYSEPTRLNFIYEIQKENWLKKKSVL